MKKNDVHTNDIKPDAIKRDVNKPDVNRPNVNKSDAVKLDAIKPEENYTQFMEECILPYILPRREECYLSREAGQQIYCAFYTAGEGHLEQRAEADECDKDVSGIILIAHGFGETADKYFEVIYYFLKAGYHVCIPEHCGHASEPLYQTCAASYGWLREAVRLNRFLLREAWKQTEVPVLLIQAERDTAVSKEQQELFMRKLPASAEIVCIPGTKHEIFRSDDETVWRYMDRVLKFLSP